MKGGIVYLVGAGPGDPSLITLRGLECLKQANVVVYDRLVNCSLLTYATRAKLIDVGKQPNRHTMQQVEINTLLIREAGAGNIVVRLKGGDPFVFGRGGEEAIALAEAGLPFEIVPGVTSAIAAPAYAGIPVTHRKMACSVAFATGHRADFIEDPACDWRRLASSTDTLVFLMGVYNLPHIVEQLVAHGLSPQTPVALVEQATRTHQKTVVGTLSNIVEQAAEVQPPAAIIIGEVVKLRDTLRWFDLPSRRPLLGLRVLNTQAASEAGELSRRLMALGAEPVELPTTQAVPVIDSGPLDAAIRRLREGLGRAETNDQAFDWIIFANAKSASFFINRLFALGHDVRVLSAVKLAIADRDAAETLLEYGLVADFIPIRNVIQDIASVLGNITSQRIFVLCSAVDPSNSSTTKDLIDTLRAWGIQVETMNTHTIQTTNPDPEALSVLFDGSLKVATFTDPLSLASLAKILHDRSVADVLSPLTVACIDPATSDAAAALGVRVDLVADVHTIEGMIKTLVKWRTVEQSS